jgi:hypothetical protein
VVYSLRLFYNGYTWIVIGTAVILWHGFNMLRPQPQSKLDFVAIRRGESAWALLIGIAMIVIGWLLLAFYPATRHFY